MTDPSPTNNSSTIPSTQTQGITEIRQKTIAAMITRGVTVKDIAKKLKMSESRIYHLLSDTKSVVNTEINRILKQLFTDNDRHLVKLYGKALQKLDAMLSSPNQEKQFRAIDRIIKLFLARSARNPVTVQQFFGVESPEDEKKFITKIDDLILEKRKQRGLSEDDHDETGSHPVPMGSPDSSPHDSSPHDSFPATTSPDAESPDTSSPDISPELKEFLGSMK